MKLFIETKMLAPINSLSIIFKSKPKTGTI